ncbi:L-lysine exporter family protein LysE/ArgO [Anaerosolibacter carboniphilus]|uniref:L-lysine exporter family protein LysE/ArgO n=1 Tax=Anaerosolibacter carboniphilus TaxID=1417629 RepID=A0A841KSZ7_9FIRM|nr:LysE family transporter [Anaerosolibacter carboniphilus]MBB6214032.1 L-lysine exporter family protein LysE/ArgO [Anaerosolibacter carboniphilus]
MYSYLLQGFMLGLAYVAPIGMQNLYVINTAVSMKRMRAYQVALITTFFDISLAIACFFGMGLLMDQFVLLKKGILLVGGAAVIYIGFGLIRSVPKIHQGVNVNKTLLETAAICFAVTWLNPQALIDGSLLLGGFRASLPPEASKVFIYGVCAASFTWFMGLATVVSTFRSMINSKVLRWINWICGSIIIYYGLKLLYDFIKMM